MKKLLLIALLTTVAMSANAQHWNENTTTTSLFADPIHTKVGIGINTPETILHLNRSKTSGDDILRFSYETDNTIGTSTSWNYLNMGGTYLSFNARQRNNKWEVDDGSYMATAMRMSYEWGGLQFDWYTHPSNHQGAATQIWKEFTSPWKTAILIKRDGNVKIGEKGAGGAHGNYRLSVDGKIVAREYVATMHDWADYVFDDSYKLIPLDLLENYLQKNNHLPNIPSAKQIKENGLEITDMTRLQMEKIEELTLYLIDLNKQYTMLAKEIETLKNGSYGN